MNKFLTIIKRQALKHISAQYSCKVLLVSSIGKFDIKEERHLQIKLPSHSPFRNRWKKTYLFLLCNP